MPKKILLCALLCCLFLTGCSSALSSDRAVEELLRAPSASEQQSALVQALEAVKGKTVQLKYPRSGNETSPMVFADFDADGMQEAALLCVSDTESLSVQLLVFEWRDTVWELAAQVDGLAVEVATLELCQVTDNGTQLLIGYANSTMTDHYLGVYDYDGATLTPLVTQAYHSYTTIDLENNGTNQLIIVPPATNPGALQLFLYDCVYGVFAQTQTQELDERFTSCTAMFPTRTGEKYGLVVEGSVTLGGIANDILRYEDGKLSRIYYPHTVNIIQDTLRTLPALTAHRFSEWRAMEVPMDVTAINTLFSANRFYQVSWCDYLVRTNAQRFGIYDDEYHYFVQLPLAWKDKVKVTDSGAQGGWQVRSTEDNIVLATFFVQKASTALGPYDFGMMLGDNMLIFALSDACDPLDKFSIIKNMTLLP